MNYIHASWLIIKIYSHHIYLSISDKCGCKRRVINNDLSPKSNISEIILYDDDLQTSRDINTEYRLPCVCSEYYSIVENSIKYIKHCAINLQSESVNHEDSKHMIDKKLAEFNRDYRYIISMCSKCNKNVDEKFEEDYKKIKHFSGI